LMATANPTIDMKWLTGFKTYQRGADANNKKAEPKEKPKGALGTIADWIKKGADAMKPKAEKSKSKTPVYKGLDKEGNPIFE